MKKFALVLVTVLLVLSCNNKGNSCLLLDVHEIDYRNKSDVTLTGVPVKTEWPIDIYVIGVCDSFLLVQSGEKTNMLYVYSDELELKGRFCNIGRARNEFLSMPSWNSKQILRNSQGDALLPFLTHDQGVKVVDLQESLAAQSAVIASQNGFTGESIYEHESPAQDGRIARLHTYGDCIFLDDNINYRFEYYDPIILYGEVHKEPSCFVTRDSARIKEIRMFNGYKVPDMIYSGCFLFKHPSRNLIIQLYAELDYIMFFDLDNDRNYAIHQTGSLSFDDNLPEIVREEITNPNGTMSMRASTIDHFMKAACAESFFMVTYFAGDYSLNQPDKDHAAPELLFFDYDGNFLKSVKMDTRVNQMAYDEKRQILYTLDRYTESVYRYDLSSIIRSL